MPTDITKDSNRLLRKMYKHYKKQIKAGASKSDAKSFGEITEMLKQVPTKLSYDDAIEVCGELEEADYIVCFWADNRPIRITLTNKAIILMESFIKRTVKQIAVVAKELKP